jgi:hypothetical protein
VDSKVAFPWYDSPWLQAYVRAKAIIREVCPAALVDFEQALSVLQAPRDFQVEHLRSVLTPEEIEAVHEVVSGLRQEDYERHELFQFGRLVVHDHPEFTRLQHKFTSRVSELAGEELEPSYNFLSLYNNLGVCMPHMDAPNAKWTLDICVDQSEPWPISFSQPVRWPEEFHGNRDSWHSQILEDPSLEFSTFAPQVNEAIFFAGGNQWHYRDRIARTKAENFCHLLFFHFIPAGCAELVDPANWSEIFDISELAGLRAAVSQAFA